MNKVKKIAITLTYEMYEEIVKASKEKGLKVSPFIKMAAYEKAKEINSNRNNDA